MWGKPTMGSTASLEYGFCGYSPDVWQFSGSVWKNAVRCARAGNVGGVPSSGAGDERKA